MAILCGTDFSEASNDAVEVAGRLAAKMGVTLHLVHALDVPVEARGQEPHDPLLSFAENHLARRAERLRRAGTRVESHVRVGVPDEVLRTLAGELSVQLIVIGALGQRRPDASRLGSHADRTAKDTHVPILVVRGARPFEQWIAGTHALRVVLGVDASLSSETAGRWIAQLAAFGPCEVVLTHLYSAPEEFQRLGLRGFRNWVDPDPEVTRTFEQEYSERFAALFSAAQVTFRLEPHFGRIGDGLAVLAAKEHADLVVVGCHDRGALARAWEGSVSFHVLRWAGTSVACIPAPLAAPESSAKPIRSVLVATDFSSTGNAAIPLAYSAVTNAGTVHLVHVIGATHPAREPRDIFVPSQADPAAYEAARARLAELVPKDFGGAGATTRLHVLEAKDAHVAICQAAERLGVDLICLGTHGRTGLARTVLGSVASSVLAETTRPVLLARTPKP